MIRNIWYVNVFITFFVKWVFVRIWEETSTFFIWSLVLFNTWMMLLSTKNRTNEFLRQTKTNMKKLKCPRGCQLLTLLLHLPTYTTLFYSISKSCSSIFQTKRLFERILTQSLSYNLLYIGMINNSDISCRKN